MAQERRKQHKLQKTIFIASSLIQKLCQDFLTNMLKKTFTNIQHFQFYAVILLLPEA